MAENDHPEHWSDAARDAFDNVLDQREDLAGAEFSALEQAAELISTADVLDEAARAEGLLVKGSVGQLVTNPAVTEARLARTAAAGILARLTAPTTSTKRTDSERGRAAARARWSSKR